MKDLLAKIGAASVDVQKELISKITKAKDANEVVTIVKEAGITISNEVAKELLQKAKSAIELTKEGLKAVAGGSEQKRKAPCYK